MNFNEFKYEPVDISKVKNELGALVDEFKNAQSAKEQIRLVQEINDYRSHVDTMFQLCNVRFTINTLDKYYAKEQDDNDMKMPEYQAIIDSYYRVLNTAKYKDALVRKYGELLFKQIEVQLKTFSPAIIEDLKEENKWSSQYSKLISSAKIKYKGKTYNLPSMRKFMVSEDRRTRSSAFKAVSNWFEVHCAEFDEIYDKLVHIRDTMAHKLGFENYDQLGYYRLGRTDFGPEEVKAYREQIYKTVVPIAKKLYRKQAKRLNLKGMKSYDYNLQFTNGNATPIGDTNTKVNNAIQMYDEMSPETGEFFHHMVDCGLIDLDAKPGKMSGGYTCTFSEYKTPFVFSNFNGTSGDIDVLTHEMGHAFMAYTVYKNHPSVLNEQVWPTYEACEIHSMSMEFFAYPYMERFFEKDTKKYLYSHLVDAVEFLPYGAAIDEFQHFVYENPNVKPVERRAKWREIEHKYQPHLKYSTPFFESGAKWFQQLHVFQSPFYYIDYTLAQVCAFAFFNLMREDPKAAWDKYLYLCDLGGSKSFLNLLKAIKFVDPFKP
ncbi:MAG: M3 family oligoendopeptidase, partial [Bacilli bacterium]|nr:M3 family oligoendopeptidase [Bacilli bacterium]